MHDLKGKRVVVMGLGRFGGGVGAARFCVAEGARVLVTDLEPAEKLSESMGKLADLTIEYRLGGHEVADFTGADFVIVNPAVDPRKNQYLQAATAAGVTLTSEIELAIQRLPNRMRTIGVTGTAGKSTTTAMIGHVLNIALSPEENVHVGGNIGGSLLGKLGEIRAEDWVVLELSSFMLEGLRGWSPHVAVVTNISDNHLDRHETMAAYTAAKQQILREQREEDYAVLGRGVADWAAVTRGEVRIVDGEYEGELLLPGAHNRFNAAAAVAACELAGVDAAAARKTLATFAGLPHRLQFVCEHCGIRFYNDSKSTTPAAAILALESFPVKSVHIILGGFDKHSELGDMAQRAAVISAGVYTIGQTGPVIADVAEKILGAGGVRRCQTLETAVLQAIRGAKPGQVIVLSPGCASWDQFENYEARGRMFAELALRYTTET